MEKEYKFQPEPNDDQPKYGRPEGVKKYNENLNEQLDKAAKEDADKAKQERINKTGHDILERLNRLGKNPKEDKRPDKFIQKNR